MQDAFSLYELLVGNTGVKKLSRAKIAVFGLAELVPAQSMRLQDAAWAV